MLTLPDFKEKKIICIEAKDDIESQLKFRNSNICLYKDGQFVNQISCHLVLSVFIIGHVTLTSVLIQKAKKHGTSFFLLDYSFKPYAEINSVAEGNYVLRGVQYGAKADNQLEQARRLISNKVANQLVLIKKYDKDLYVKLNDTVQDKIVSSDTFDSLRGIEGSVSSVYFSAIFASLGWNRRAPQTKEDIPNLLLDIGYTFLLNYVDSLLRLFGFDTYKGFYHKLFFQRQSLSCDMMEPLRPVIDKAVIKAYNLKRINEKDFVFKNGSFNFKQKTGLRKKYTKILFDAISDRKEEIYEYLRAYYLHVMNPERYQFPTFRL